MTGPANLVVIDLDDARHNNTGGADRRGEPTYGRHVLAELASAAGEPYPSGTYTVRTRGVINGRSSRLSTVFDEGHRWAIRFVESVLSGGVNQRAEAAVPRLVRVTPW